MKFILGLILMFTLAKAASASEAISLYAQGCLPYIENDSFYFNCFPQESIEIPLKDTGSGFQIGNWSKIIQLGSSSFAVSIEIQKITMPDGMVTELITGQINQDSSRALVTTSNSLNADTSVSIGSLIPYGDKKGFPHFFFGIPSKSNTKVNELVMRKALLPIH